MKRMLLNTGSALVAATAFAAATGGVALAQFDRKLKDCILVAVTERRTRAEIDAYAEALTSAVA